MRWLTLARGWPFGNNILSTFEELISLLLKHLLSELWREGLCSALQSPLLPSLIFSSTNIRNRPGGVCAWRTDPLRNTNYCLIQTHKWIVKFHILSIEIKWPRYFIISYIQWKLCFTFAWYFSIDVAIAMSNSPISSLEKKLRMFVLSILVRSQLWRSSRHLSSWQGIVGPTDPSSDWRPANRSDNKFESKLLRKDVHEHESCK